MKSPEFSKIIKTIMDQEGIDLATLARQAKANRSYLSKVINSEEAINVGNIIRSKLEKAFPSYFQKNNANNTPNLFISHSSGDGLELRLKEILANLSDLKTGQSQLWNQGQMIRQDVAGVSNYLMLKDAEWDPEKLKELKDTYYKAVHAGPGKVL